MVTNDELLLSEYGIYNRIYLKSNLNNVKNIKTVQIANFNFFLELCILKLLKTFAYV